MKPTQQSVLYKRCNRNLHWSVRLTIILVGTSFLFSLFFALEFFMAKLLADSLEPPLLNESCATTADSHWSQLVQNSSNETTTTTTTINKLEKSTIKLSKLGFNFDLIYEREWPISADGNYYTINGQRFKIDPELKLGRLLEGYHVAMPFNPDIWQVSEPHKQLPELLSGDLSKCSRDLSSLLSLLDNGDANQVQSAIQRYRLMQLMDSFGRPEAGTLSGHPYWLGSYQQCQQVVGLSKPPLELPSGDDKKLKTRYCIGKVALESWQTRLNQTNSHAAIKVGLCLPKSCDSLVLFKAQQVASNKSLDKVEIVRHQMEQLMLKNFDPNHLYLRSQPKLMDVYCLPLEESRRLGTTAFLLGHFLFNWLLISILCTWLRWQRLKGCKQKFLPEVGDRFLEIMAIDVNIEQFVSFYSNQNKQTTNRRLVNLSVLDSFKHFGCIGVICSHILLSYLVLGTSYSHIIEDIGRQQRTKLLLSLNNMVDTFFVITGLLVAYLMFRKLEPGLEKEDKQQQQQHNKRKSWLKQYARIVLGRYLRMAPLYFLVYTFSKSVAVHLGSGPLWDYATNDESMRSMCKQESWLWPLTFSSNFKPITEHCIPAAWSIGTDLQFFLILPLCIALLHRQPQLGRIILVASIVGSSCYTLQAYKSLLDYVSLKDLAKLRLHVFTILIRHHAHAYTQPQNRISPILIGLLGGHLLHEYERRNRKLELANTHDKTVAKLADNVANNLWPRWMRGNYFRATLMASVLFILAPTVVELREQLRNDPKQSGLFWWWLLNLGSSLEFDCNLAMIGLVLIKPLWAICNCILFLRLATDLQATTLIGRLLSLPYWTKLSKLNYAILLIHFEFISYEAMSRLSLEPQLTWTYLMGKFTFAYLSSLLAALPLYVLFEQPMQKLTNWLLLE